MKDPAFPAPWAAWGNVAILMVLFVVATLDRQLMALVVDPIRHDLGLSDVQIGLLQGIAFSVFYVLFGLPIGSLIDRLPRRGLIYSGVAVWSVFTLGCGLTGSFLTLLLCRMGVGVGEAVLTPASYSIASDSFPPRKLGFAIAILSMGNTLGGAVALIVGGSLLHWLMGPGAATLGSIAGIAAWRWAFLITGLPGALIGLIVFAVRIPPRPKTSHSYSAEWSEFFNFVRGNARYFFFVYGCIGLNAILGFGLFAWAPTFLMRERHLPVDQASAIVAMLSVIGSLIGYPFGGWISDRMFARGHLDAHFRCGLFVFPVLAVISLLGLVLSQNLTVNLAAIALIIVGTPMVVPIYAHVQLSTPPRFRARSAALTLIAQQLLGLGFGPLLVAAVNQYLFRGPGHLGTSIGLVFTCLAPVAFLSFVAVLPHARSSIAAAAGEGR